MGNLEYIEEIKQPLVSLSTLYTIKLTTTIMTLNINIGRNNP